MTVERARILERTCAALGKLAQDHKLQLVAVKHSRSFLSFKEGHEAGEARAGMPGWAHHQSGA